MSFQKNKTDSYCVDQKHYSGTKNTVGEMTFNKKTGREIKILVGQCSICNRKKSMVVSDKTIQAEGLAGFFKKLGKISARAGKKLATNVIRNPGRAFEVTSNTATAATTKSPKAAFSSLPEVISLYHTGKGLYLGKFV